MNRNIIKNILLIMISLFLTFILIKIFFPKMLFFTSPKKDIKRKINQMGEPLNAYILKVIESYLPEKAPRMCRKEETNKKLGVTKDIYYQGELVAEAGPDPCMYCIGLIFEVYMSAWDIVLKEKNIISIGSLDKKSIKEFRRVFYGTNGNERTCVAALIQYGLGVEIPDLSLAQPGDLIQFWRYNKTGHCVIFIKAEKDLYGKINGIHYWSAQLTTNGISYKSEYIGKQSGNIDINKIFIVRPIISYY